MPHPRWFKPLVAAMLVVGGVLPVLFYAWLFGGISGISSEDALRLLERAERDTLLIDVRSAGEYEAMHVTGSFSYPLGDIATIQTPQDLPVELMDKTLVLICNSGLLSAQAAHKLQAMGIRDIYSVQGGLQSWIRAGAEHPEYRFSQVVPLQKSGGTYRPMPLYEQVATVVSGFGIKPVHMLLSLAVGWVLLRQKASDLRTLGWGVLIFLASETACAANYLFFDHKSYLAEYLHSSGMVVAFGFTIYAVVEGLDTRLVNFSAPDKRCMLLGLCRGCVKYEQGYCKLRRLFQLGMVMLAILGFIPLLAQPSNTSYSTHILGTQYHYCRQLLYQIYEMRYLPGIAIVLFLLALLVMYIDKDAPVPLLARLFASAGLGALGFSLFRLMLGLVYQNTLIWADFWEEATELMFVVAILAVLWTYRDALLKKPQS